MSQAEYASERAGRAIENCIEGGGGSNKPTSQMQSMIDALEKQTIHLAAQFSSLAYQLRPVTTPEPPVPEATRDNRTEVAPARFAGRLGVVSERIALITRELSSLRDRLEV